MRSCRTASSAPSAASCPVAYTVILEASAEVPREMRNRDGEIGLRMPDLAVCRMLIELLGEPLVSGSVTAGDEEPAARGSRRARAHLPRPDRGRDRWRTALARAVDDPPGPGQYVRDHACGQGPRSGGLTGRVMLGRAFPPPSTASDEAPQRGKHATALADSTPPSSMSRRRARRRTSAGSRSTISRPRPAAS